MKLFLLLLSVVYSFSELFVSNISTGGTCTPGDPCSLPDALDRSEPGPIVLEEGHYQNLGDLVVKNLGSGFFVLRGNESVDISKIVLTNTTIHLNSSLGSYSFSRITLGDGAKIIGMGIENEEWLVDLESITVYKPEKIIEEAVLSFEQFSSLTMNNITFLNGSSVSFPSEAAFSFKNIKNISMTNVYFSHYNGFGMFLESSSSINIQHFVYEDGSVGPSAINIPLIKIEKVDSLSISESTFSRNVVSLTNSFLEIGNVKIARVTNCVFEENEGIYGGGMHLYSAEDKYNVFIDSSTFLRNKAFNGGGFIAFDEYVEIKNSYFEENEAENKGGDILVHGCAFQVISSGAADVDDEYNNTFSRNSKAAYGGSIFISFPLGIYMTNKTIFEGNTGGSIHLLNPVSPFYFHDLTFYEVKGSAIYIEDVPPFLLDTPELKNIECQHCQAEKGSCIHLVDVKFLSIFYSSEDRNTAFELSNNKATSLGGVFYFKNSDVQMYSSVYDSIHHNISHAFDIVLMNNEAPFGGVFALEESNIISTTECCVDDDACLTSSKCFISFNYTQNTAEYHQGDDIFVKMFDNNTIFLQLELLGFDNSSYETISSPPQSTVLTEISYKSTKKNSWEKTFDAKSHVIRYVFQEDIDPSNNEFSVYIDILDYFDNKISKYEGMEFKMECITDDSLVFAGKSLGFTLDGYDRFFEDLTFQTKDVAPSKTEDKDVILSITSIFSNDDDEEEQAIDPITIYANVHIKRTPFGLLFYLVVFVPISLVMTFSCILMFLFGFMFICGGLFALVIYSSGKRMKYFGRIDNVDLVIQEQELEKSSFGGLSNLKIFDKTLLNIKMDEIRFEEILGSGGQCTVYKVEYKNRKYAFKNFKARNLLEDKSMSQSFLEEFEREATILSSFRHRNILGFFGVVIHPPKVGILIELCEKGDLKHFLTEYHEEHDVFYPFEQKMIQLIDLCHALMELHSREIIHRDLKCENVLVDGENVIKLMDFGLSRVLRDKAQSSLTRGIGTSVYMSPELIRGEDYDWSVDVFAFSILMWMVLTDNFKPYENEESPEYKVANNPFFRPPQAILREKLKKENSSKDSFSWISSLLKRCWSHDPKKRPSFLSILNVLEKKKEESIVIYALKVDTLDSINEEEAEDFLLEKKTFEEMKKVLIPKEEEQQQNEYRFYLKKEEVEETEPQKDNLIPISNDQDMKQLVFNDSLIIYIAE